MKKIIFFLFILCALFSSAQINLFNIQYIGSKNFNQGTGKGLQVGTSHDTLIAKGVVILDSLRQAGDTGVVGIYPNGELFRTTGGGGGGSGVDTGAWHIGGDSLGSSNYFIGKNDLNGGSVYLGVNNPIPFGAGNYVAINPTQIRLNTTESIFMNANSTGTANINMATFTVSETSQRHQFFNHSTTCDTLQLYDLRSGDAAGGTKYVGIVAPDSVTGSSYTMVLPRYKPTVGKTWYDSAHVGQSVLMAWTTPFRSADTSHFWRTSGNSGLTDCCGAGYNYMGTNDAVSLAFVCAGYRVVRFFPQDRKSVV